MTNAEIKSYVGSKTNLVNSLGQIIDGLITDNILQTFINTQYKSLYYEFVESFPELYEVEAKIDLTSGQFLYAFKNDVSDAFTVRWLGAKFSSTDTKYTRLRRKDYRQIIPNDDDISAFVTANPFYSFTSEKDGVSGKLTQAIRITPTPTATVTEGLKMIYTEEPQLMINPNDTPYTIPEKAHILIAMAVISDIWETKGDWPKSERTMNRFLQKKKEFFDNWMPLASDEPAYFTPDRSFNPFARNS